MQKDERYSYVWPDGSVIKYTITDVTPKIIWIMWDNGIANCFTVGSDMYKNSKKI